jgi:hypothetical protein
MKWRPPGRRKRGRPKLTRAEGIRGLMGEKGIGGGRLERHTQLEEEDNVINKWEQEDVNRLYSVNNNNNNNNNNNVPAFFSFYKYWPDDGLFRPKLVANI